MNNYPIWWDATVTIFNKYEDSQTQLIKWYKTILHGCFWKYIGDKIAIGETVLATNNIICRIPEDSKFLPNYEWIKIPNDKMNEYFTLNSGDIIVLGEIDDEIDEYKSGHRSNDLILKYKKLQGCMEIEQIAINTGLGRCNPHYYVKGI